MADALTVARTLHLEADEDLAMVVELLGLSQGLEDTEPTPRSARRAPIREPSGISGRGFGYGHSIPAAGRVGLRTVVEALPPDPVAPITFEQAEPLVPGAPGGGSLPYEPIVPLHQLRAAMTMIIRRPRRSVQPDIEAAVELIAEQRPLDHLPRQVEQTVDGGVTIIADVGPEMLPYLEDVNHLVQAAEHVAGTPRTAVLWIEDCGDLPPLETGPPIMIISTFGAARSPASPPGAAARWRELARRLINSETDATAVVPHRRTRGASGRMRSVTWDDLAEVGRGRA
jgi:hypothetical protein